MSEEKLIEKRIEWKCPDRKRHNVALFGSWNGFKGGDELEYQGKQVFACMVKLPLGTYVYRFLIDAEDWTTMDNAPKTAKNGIEYNQIDVTGDNVLNKNDQPSDDVENEHNHSIILGSDGKLMMSKKPYGQPCMSLKLDCDFFTDGETKDDEADESENNSKKRKKKKKNKNAQQDKELAKYVFVQQLRLQQQHNDEINRVKTLWKQERQVRVEMHKKVVKQLKQHKKKSQEQTVEIARLNKNRERVDANLKDSMNKLQQKDKAIKQYQSQVKTLEQTLIGLEANMTSIKYNHDKKVKLLTEQYTERERQYQQQAQNQLQEMKLQTPTIKASNKNNESINDNSFIQQQNKLKKQLKDLQSSINEKNESLLKLTQDLADAKEEIEKYKNNESALNSEIQKLETKVGKQHDLEVDLAAEKANLEIEKQNNAETLASHVQIEKLYANGIKTLFVKITSIREEIKKTVEASISQMEQVTQFFLKFGVLLRETFEFNQNMIDDLLAKYKRELSLRRTYFNMSQDLRGNVRVICRFRPLSSSEISNVSYPMENIVQVVDNTGKKYDFEFDLVYSHIQSSNVYQQQMFEDCIEYIAFVMDGYNVSIFSFGSVHSNGSIMEGTVDSPGMNVGALNYLFKTAKSLCPQFQYDIKLSIVEIRNEKIHDLLFAAESMFGDDQVKKKKNNNDNIKIRHLPDGSVTIDGLTKIHVSSDKDVMKLKTDMNESSSNGHIVWIVEVFGVNIVANIKYFAKLYLVNFSVAKNENQSLLAISDVMETIQKKQQFIPYKNSILTEVMADGLGGNAKTIMFVNCSPAKHDTNETIKDLSFGQKMKGLA